MSLPRYVVNLEELSSLVEEVFGSLRESGKPIKTNKQMTKGIRLVTSKRELRVVRDWIPDEDIWITGVKLGISNKESMSGNKISILLNGEYLLQDVFFKKESDYKNFRSTQKVEAGDRVSIIFRGSHEEIEAWLDFDYTNDSASELIIQPKIDIQNDGGVLD